MTRLIAAVLSFPFLAQAALASSPPPASSGHGALALGVLVGLQSPVMSAAQKAVLEALIGDAAPASAHNLKITAKSVVCHAGDVDIAAFGCTLTYGAQTISLTGRQAHEIFATLAENGVQLQGAAGTIYAAVHAFSCALNPAETAGKNGSGASCAFTQGP